MRFDLRTLRLFVTAVQDGSIAAAAERHNIAPSAVSRRLADMEHMLGTAALYRSRSGVTPTPAGEALFRHGQNLLRLADRMEAELSAFAAGDRGHVRVAANTSSVTQFLPGELAAFTQVNPDIRIDLAEQVSEVIVRDVADGHADIGLFSETVDPGDLEVLPYRADRLMVLLPAGHPLADDVADDVAGDGASVAAGAVGPGLRLAQVLDHPVVGLQTGSSLHARIERAAADLGRDLACRIQVTSFDGLRRMVAAGLGLGFLPEGAVTPYLGPSLTARPLDEAWARRRLLLGVRDAQALSVVARRLLAHLAGAAPGG